MLVATELRDWLREFCDRAYAGFRAFPPTREDARREWAQAFARYFATIVEVSPEDVELAAATASMTIAPVEPAFFDDLGLENTPTARVAAEDFAGAWRVSLAAVTAGAGASDGSADYVFTAFVGVDPLHDALRDRLTELFSSPSSDALQRLGEIADAFHLATSSLQAEVTRTAGTSPVTITFR